MGQAMRIPLRIVLILTAVWILAGAVIFWMRAARPTPASLAAYIDRHPIENLGPAQRAKEIEAIARQLNKLNFDQRQEFRRLKTDRRLFQQMTPEERARFLDLTLPEGYRQLMIALNKMQPERRKKLVQRALDDIEKDRPEIAGRLDQAEVQKFISQGMESFYKEASSDVKLDFAPVIEQLQRVTQGLR